MCAVCSVLPCDHIKGLNKLHVAGLRHNIYSCPLSLLAAVVRMCQEPIVLLSTLLKLQSAAQVSPAPIKSLTLTTLTPTQSPSMMETRGCVLVAVLMLLAPGEGCVPAAPPAPPTTTTSPPQPTTGPQAECCYSSSHQRNTYILCCAFYRIIPGYYEYCIIRQTQLPIFTFFSILYTKDCQRCNYW